MAKNYRCNNSKLIGLVNNEHKILADDKENKNFDVQIYFF